MSGTDKAQGIARPLDHGSAGRLVRLPLNPFVVARLSLLFATGKHRSVDAVSTVELDPSLTLQTIWAAILTAGVMIAEVSALNANVFYELGLAHALGKDVFILKQLGSTVPADFGGTHYYEYDLQDLAAGQAMLQFELAKWASDNRAQGVKTLYET